MMEPPDYDQYVSGTCPEMYQPTCRLLAHLSTLVNNSTIVDFRTGNGSSAFALAYNQTNTVVTYDTESKVMCEKIKTCSRIKYSTTGSPPSGEDLMGASMIYIDRPHSNGSKAYEFYSWLKTSGYKGLLVYRGIWSQKELHDQFWGLVPDNMKVDLSLQTRTSNTMETGVPNGIGLIFFGQCCPTGMQPMSEINQDWTLVTAYFDLSGYCDMNPSVRSKNFYFDHIHSVIMYPCPLVVYCDQGSLEEIKKVRPEHLQSRTRYVVLDFDQLSFEGHDGYENKKFHEYRQQIIANRKAKPYQFDARNTASYYLFCISRNLILKKTIKENPFNSTHFAWINICIERYGYSNVIHLGEALGFHRNRFSTCYIDYVAQETVDKPSEYFTYGRCSMCSGFYTGNSEYMYKACHEIESQFLEYLEQGYGHADEQLFSPVYFKHPDLFDHYYGDYTEMITNYAFIYEHPEKPLSNFIKKSFDCGFYRKCYEACQFIWNSYLKRKCSLNRELFTQLEYYRTATEVYLSRHNSGTQFNIIPLFSQKSPTPSTIITTVYDLGNQFANTYLERYFAQVKQWTRITFPMVIWTNNGYYSRLNEIFKDKPNVKIINQEMENFPQYQKYISDISRLYTEFKVYDRSSSKDTIPYHLLMYTRPHMWAQTIKENPFGTETFMCLDFGLTRFTDDITVVEYWRVGHKLRAMMINPYHKKMSSPSEYFHKTWHNIAGGLLTGGGQEILKYVNYFDLALEQMIKDNWCQLDEALLACVARDHSEIFNFYDGDYQSIISNYEVLRNNMSIVTRIIETYLNNHMHREAQEVLDQIDYNWSEYTRYTFVNYSVITNYYTMGGYLSPLVIELLKDPVNQSLKDNIVSRQSNNLKYYKNLEGGTL